MYTAAHAELQEYKELISDTQKVTDFIAGISCPKLEMAKAHILVIDILNEKFDPCQNYTKIYLNVKESEKGMRSISDIDVDSQAHQANTNNQHGKQIVQKKKFSNKELKV